MTDIKEEPKSPFGIPPRPERPIGIPALPELRSMSAREVLEFVHEKRRRDRRKGAWQREGARAIRRILIEELLFPSNPRTSELPERYRRKPHGQKTIEWIIGYFQKINASGVKYTLYGTAEDTIHRGMTAIMKQRAGREFGQSNTP